LGVFVAILPPIDYKMIHMDRIHDHIDDVKYSKKLLSLMESLQC